MYHLQKTTDIIETIIKSENKESLIEEMNNLYLKDRDINVNCDYRVVSDDELLIEELAEKNNITIIGGEEKYFGNRNDMRNFFEDLKNHNL